MKKIVLLCLTLTLATASPLQDGKEAAGADDHRYGKSVDNELVKGHEDGVYKKLNLKCSQKDTSSCVMLKLVTYMNRLLKKSSLEITDSVEITQTSPVDGGQDDSSRGFLSDDADLDLSQFISDKLWSFVKSRSLRLKVLPETDLVLSTTTDTEGGLNLGVALRSNREAKNVESGRGKNKNMGPLIAAGIMKIGMLKLLAFKALAFLVGKALLVSKLAFLLAAIIGLKKLLSGHKHVTYEVVSHPHHVEHGGHESSGWGRSGEAAQSMAYRGQLVQ